MKKAMLRKLRAIKIINETVDNVLNETKPKKKNKKKKSDK